MSTQEPRKRLESYLEFGTVDNLAVIAGVSRAAIYKFIKGGDIRLSTWLRIEPHLDRRIGGDRRRKKRRKDCFCSNGPEHELDAQSQTGGA